MIKYPVELTADLLEDIRASRDEQCRILPKYK
jgi:hypothetical protein